MPVSITAHDKYSTYTFLSSFCFCFIILYWRIELLSFIDKRNPKSHFFQRDASAHQNYKLRETQRELCVLFKITQLFLANLPKTQSSHLCSIWFADYLHYYLWLDKHQVNQTHTRIFQIVHPLLSIRMEKSEGTDGSQNITYCNFMEWWLLCSL